MGKRAVGKMVATGGLHAACVMSLAACVQASAQSNGSAPSQETIKAGRVLFDERCKTVAGQKIYRTVEDVEGIVLLKVRPKHTEADLSDRDWPGAAFAKEETGDGYLTTFLGYEHSTSPRGEPVTPKDRGTIGTTFRKDNPSNLPGYRYVDVVDEKTGERWRYSGSEREVPTVNSILIGGDGKTYMVKRYVLDRKPAPKDGPRYGVTYEDHVIPAERALGVASSTVKVIDLQTQEVLGEMTMYAWTLGVLFKGPQQPASPWLSAYRCGNDHPFFGFETRLFTDQVLKIRQDK